MKEVFTFVVLLILITALLEPQRFGQIAAGIQAGYEQARNPKPEAP
jgi:hypothetical protein